MEVVKIALYLLSLQFMTGKQHFLLFTDHITGRSGWEFCRAGGSYSYRRSYPSGCQSSTDRPASRDASSGYRVRRSVVWVCVCV